MRLAVRGAGAQGENPAEDPAENPDRAMDAMGSAGRSFGGAIQILSEAGPLRSGSVLDQTASVVGSGAPAVGASMFGVRSV